MAENQKAPDVRIVIDLNGDQVNVQSSPTTKLQACAMLAAAQNLILSQPDAPPQPKLVMAQDLQSMRSLRNGHGG